MGTRTTHPQLTQTLTLAGDVGDSENNWNRIFDWEYYQRSSIPRSFNWAKTRLVPAAPGGFFLWEQAYLARIGLSGHVFTPRKRGLHSPADPISPSPGGVVPRI